LTVRALRQFVRSRAVAHLVVSQVDYEEETTATTPKRKRNET